MIGPTLLRALGWALLLSLGQGLVIAGAFALLRRLRPTDPVRTERLAFAAQLAIVLVFVVTAAALCRGWQPAQGDAMPRALPTLSGQSSAALLASAAVSARPYLTNMLGWLDRFALWSSVLWLMGVAVALAIVARRWRTARHLVRFGSIRTDLAPLVAVIAREMGVHGPVATVQTGVSSPAMVGWRTPVILLPDDVDHVLTREQLRAVIAHELAHVRRQDYVQHVLQSLASALLFFHPAVRWLDHCIRGAREEACDDLALRQCRNAIVYARALERLESARSRFGRAAAALAVIDGELVARIRRVVARDQVTHGTPGGFFSLLAPFLSLPVLLACALPVAVAPAVPVALGRLHNAVYNVSAEDPAGHFTVTVFGDRVLAATLSGAPVPAAQLRQTADELYFLNTDGSTDFTIRVTASGIHWSPRPPTRPSG